jgi:hypothetical protein
MKSCKPANGVCIFRGHEWIQRLRHLEVADFFVCQEQASAGSQNLVTV